MFLSVTTSTIYPSKILHTLSKNQKYNFSEAIFEVYRVWANASIVNFMFLFKMKSRHEYESVLGHNMLISMRRKSFVASQNTKPPLPPYYYATENWKIFVIPIKSRLNIPSTRNNDGTVPF